MKTIIPAITLPAALALTAGLLWHMSQTQPADSTLEAVSMSISEKLNTIIIPEYPTKGVSLEEAVDYLRFSRGCLDDETTLPAASIIIVRTSKFDHPAGNCIVWSHSR